MAEALIAEVDGGRRAVHGIQAELGAVYMPLDPASKQSESRVPWVDIRPDGPELAEEYICGSPSAAVLADEIARRGRSMSPYDLPAGDRAAARVA